MTVSHMFGNLRRDDVGMVRGRAKCVCVCVNGDWLVMVINSELTTLYGHRVRLSVSSALFSQVEVVTF